MKNEAIYQPACGHRGDCDFVRVLDSISKRLEACEKITSFDRAIYVGAFGDSAVSFIEEACVSMADVSSEKHRVQAIANISFDAGFNACIKMIRDILLSLDVGGVTGQVSGCSVGLRSQPQPDVRSPDTAPNPDTIQRLKNNRA